MKSGLIIKQSLGTLVFFSIIFISAGRFVYLPGLVYATIGFFMLVLSYTAFQIDPELRAERNKPGDGSKACDKKILILSFISSLAMFVVGGLDSGRFGWSPHFSIILGIAGAILTAAGQLLFLIAQKQNRFFSSTVRIQTERGHQVCQTGLYSFVRHPAYLGSLIQLIGFPLLFGSLWSVIPCSIAIMILVIRTYLEDKTLMVELAGYKDYSINKPYRLIPYIW